MEPTTFYLPRTCRFLDINRSSQLALLHSVPASVSMYSIDSETGFKETWTHKAPLTGINKWGTINVTEDGGILLHNIRQETVVMDSQGQEVARWPARMLFLSAATNSHVVYRHGQINLYRLHVHAADNHLNRLAKLVPEDQCAWANPWVTIAPNGHIFVTDMYNKLLAAFSATGQRLYSQQTPYNPGPAVVCDDNLYVQTTDDLTIVHVHEIGSGQMKKSKLTAETLGLGEGDLIRRVWPGEAGKLHVAVINKDTERIMTYSNLMASK